MLFSHSIISELLSRIRVHFNDNFSFSLLSSIASPCRYQLKVAISTGWSVQAVTCVPHSCVPDLTSSDFDLQPVNKIFCRFSNRQIFRGRYYYYYYFKLFYFLRSCPYNFNERPNYRILPSILSNTCPFCVLFNRENIS